MESYRDGLLKPAVGCQRAVTEAVALLEKKGYTVVPIQGPDINKVAKKIHSYMLHQKMYTRLMNLIVFFR